MMFKEIPNTLRVPGSYMELDNSLAGSSASLKLALIIAPLATGASAIAHSPVRILSAKDAEEQLGSGDGSLLCAEFIKRNEQLELYALPVNGTETAADYAAILAGLEGFRFHWLISPENDDEVLRAICTELDSRYNAMSQMGARCIVVKQGEPAELLAWAPSFNSPHLCVLPVPSSVAEPNTWLAAFSAIITKQLAIDPSGSLNSFAVSGIFSAETLPFSIRNQFLFNGLSTWTAGNDGQVRLERIVTSYTEDADGNADSSYLDIQVPETLDAMRDYQNAAIRKQFAQHKLASDGISPRPGQKVLTPAILKGFLIGLYQGTFVGEKLWCDAPAIYKESLVVELDPEDKNRINWRDSPTLIGRFDVAAGLRQFT